MVKSFFVRGVVDGVIKFLARGEPNGKNLPIQGLRYRLPFWATVPVDVRHLWGL